MEVIGKFEIGGFKYSYVVGLEFLCECSCNDIYVVVIGSNCCFNGIGVVGGYNCMDFFNLNLNDFWVGSIRFSNNLVEMMVCM